MGVEIGKANKVEIVKGRITVCARKSGFYPKSKSDNAVNFPDC